MKFKIISSIVLLAISTSSFAQSPIFKENDSVGSLSAARSNSNAQDKNISSNKNRLTQDDIQTMVLQYLHYMMSEDPELVIKRSGLSEVSAGLVFEVLDTVSKDDKSVLNKRTNGMCETWRDNKNVPNKVRIERALEKYDSYLVSLNIERNNKYRGLLDSINRIVTADELSKFNRYIEHSIENFTGASIGSWSDTITSLGVAEQTLLHHCGE